MKKGVEKTKKSPQAFLTISEISASTDIAKHVLRFWEKKFPQIKPLKHAGKRRYYRDKDLEIIKIIKYLLYEKGYTIKGANKLLANKNFKKSNHIDEMDEMKKDDVKKRLIEIKRLLEEI